MLKCNPNKIKTVAFFAICLINVSMAIAQEDLLKELEGDQPKNYPVIATFKSSRIINGQSIETRKSGALEFIISHRFGRVNSGIENFFGLDDAYIRLGFDYAVNDNFTIGIGRSSFNKTYDGFLKYKLVKQKSSGGSPISITAFTSAAIDTQDPPEGLDIEYRHDMAYVSEILFARKFSQSFSMQLMPVWVHRNLVPTPEYTNDVFALGVAGRQKISNRTALTFEYYYQLNNTTPEVNYNALGIGFDIETGGHVFQVHLTNSRGIIEKEIIPNTNGDFFGGDIHIGFNIIRVFQLKKSKLDIPEEGY